MFGPALTNKERVVRCAVAIRAKDAQIRSAKVLPWGNLTDAEQRRWISVAEAGLKAALS